MDETVNNQNLFSYIQALEKQHQIKIYANDEALKRLTVFGHQETKSLTRFLRDFLLPFNQKVVKLNDQSLIIVPIGVATEFGNHENNYSVFPVQNGKGVIKGRIVDGNTEEALIGAQVVVRGSQKGTITDNGGNFELKVDNDIHVIDVTYIGFEKSSFVAAFGEDFTQTEIEVLLYAGATELSEVVVTAEGQQASIKEPIAGIEKMGMESIKEMPTFMGEIDPVRSLTTLPGISTVGELSSGFFVRGGNSGQNLILQDGAVVFNPSHFFGFFSAFHPDLISGLTLYKGGGPASKGRRVSSVLEVGLRNGNLHKLEVSGGIGLVSSRLTVEGPIKNGKSSFIIGGRLAYPNWLTQSTRNVDLQNSSVNFHDITAKVFHTISKDNLLSVSTYYSYDDFNFSGDSTFNWTTQNISVNWDHTFNQKLQSHLTLTSSHYQSQVINENRITGFDYQNGIHDLGLDFGLTQENSERLTLSAGWVTNLSDINPGEQSPKGESIAENISLETQKALESSLYAQADFDLTEKIALSGGLRYSTFFRLGPETIYQYDANTIVNRYPIITDSTAFDQGKVIESYSGLEPRISVRILTSSKSSIKLSYNRTYQYLHQMSNTTSTSPNDYWIASGRYIQPQMGDQYALGTFWEFDNGIEISLEGFYRDLTQALDYIDGADLTLNPQVEQGLIQGKGKSYGAEFLVKKNDGGLTGRISYTFSRSLRQFQSSEERLKVNNGKFYPSYFDQPHNVSLVVNQRLGLRTVLSANFTYQSGRPITIPTVKYAYGPFSTVLNFSERNEFRVPDYHRLDLSLTIRSRNVRNKKFDGEWVFSVFNLYSRANPYNIFFDSNGQAQKLTILGNAFPSVSYNFSF